ncbi:MAG: 2Fe-2S iron-sulfur cluster binding domain-containing protein [Betaproteobacteria bacterium]|nr:2Fe-2S iron-sulfur cluster binding domain-containing protein [Betaproteobacteria bacterium]
MFRVTIKKSGHTFEVAEGDTVLAAALAAGYTLPYGCRNGACGSCKGTVVEGHVDFGNHQPYTLTDSEKAAGLALFCCARPQSDLVIDAREVAGVGEIQVKKLPCRVQAIERPAADVVVLRLKLPANERLQFLAGQYLEIIMRDGKRRAYSMANPPHDDEFIELHVRNMKGGAFTEYVFNTMKEKDILRFEGPLGTFFLREDSDKPMLLVASGTGFAPIKAIIEHAFHAGIERPMVFYWGGRRPQDLYMRDLAESWAREHPNFSFIPVISDAEPEDAWTGRTGFVHHAVLEDFPDMSGHQAYVCGAPVVVEAAHRDFTTRAGLPDDEFNSDAFTPSVDPLKAAT